MARTDNDTWDLATSVGATATMVAAGRARATRDALIDDPFAEPLVRAVGVDFFTRWARGELDSADVDVPGAPWGMQRMTDMLAARTRYIDTFFAGAGAAGIRQVVILASGLDARAYRLPWAAGTTVFEIDQPEVIEFKTATIAGLGAIPTAEVRAVPIDLRHDWPTALRQAGFDTGRPAAWAAEGLLGFLPAEAQDRLLDDVTALSADGSRLVAEVFLNSGVNGDALNAASGKWQDNGLDIALGDLGFPGERNDAATYLEERGWRPVRTPLNQLLADNGLPLQPGDPDAPFARNYYCTAVLQKAGQREAHMPNSKAAKPLDGFRVLDFTQNVAGPLAGQVLADLGAEVIKIEAPGGEAARQITAVLPGRPPLATYFLPNNRGKKSVTVDLTTEEGKQQILRLADTADVVLEGFRPGVMERMALGPDDLRSRNPKLIYARLSAYGGNGPHGSRPGVDLMVAAEAGMTTGMPTPSGKPQIIPFQLVDNASGHVLAQAVLAALLNRERHGVADVVRVAMYDVAVGLQANQLTMHLNRGDGEGPKPESTPKTKRRKGVGFATQPSDAFRAADGYLVISAYVPKHWAKLCQIIGRPDLVDDERFVDQRARALNYPELTEELESALAVKTAAEWVELLQEGGLMACLAYTWKQVVDTPLFAENDLALPVGSGDDAITVIRTPARYSSFDAVATDPPPAPGQHNELYLIAPETA